MTTFLTVCLTLALIPAVVTAVNLLAYRPPPPAEGASPPPISVMIPARNEEPLIAEAVASVLAYRGPMELIVADDGSEDRTAEIVESIAAGDGRVRLIRESGPPPGWNGKAYACWRLAHEARFDLFVFMDADVRLEPDAPPRLARFMSESGADLASGVPRQVTVGFLERLLIPLIHFVMLGFMPIPAMRRTRMASLSAGCGQLIVARREAYFRVGGHGAIRASRHDGVKLARAFRAVGRRVDLFDATGVARCRLYRSAGEVWSGLSKNADEALAAPRLIVGMSAILLCGQVAPFLLAGAAVLGLPRPWTPGEPAMVVAAVVAAWAPRFAAAWRFRQSWLGALLHPIGVAVLVLLQWHAFVGVRSHRPSLWKGRDRIAASAD